jgi:hypothetical protein
MLNRVRIIAITALSFITILVDPTTLIKKKILEGDKG